MPSKPKLSILIATVGEREDRFRHLAQKLIKQVSKYKGQANILVYWNNFEFPLSKIRQTLVDQADGDYICFVDDDDDVPDYYVDEILKAIKTNPDYVGWRMQVYHDGQKLKPTFHSLKYDHWWDDDEGYYRDISHLNPIKRSIALKARFEDGVARDQVVPDGQPEDEPWADRVRQYVKTEVYIGKVMYFYQHDPSDSIWRGKPHSGVFQRPEIRSPHLKFVRPDGS